MTVPFTGNFPKCFLRDDGRRTATENERAVLTLIARAPASRADLARATGLAPHSITRLIEPLLERGLLIESAPRATGVGKPSAKLAIVADAAFSVGLSVMTDSVALVLLDLSGKVVGRAAAPLANTDLEAAAEQLAAMIDQTARSHRLDRSRQVGIGVGVTGYFVGEGARMNPPAQLDPWALVPLDTLLSEKLGSPVWIDNDGNVAAVGEMMLGAGRSGADFAYLYFAAGFGGGVVAGSAPMRGSHGNAGEFASILPENWPQPNLENLRSYLVDRHDRDYPDIHAMLALLDPADAAIDSWLDACTPSLNLVASAISATLDPDLIVLGGRLPPLLAERMIERIRFVNPARRNRHRPAPRIVASTLADDAAAVGAAMLPMRAAFFA